MISQKPLFVSSQIAFIWECGFKKFICSFVATQTKAFVAAILTCKLPGFNTQLETLFANGSKPHLLRMSFLIILGALLVPFVGTAWLKYSVLPSALTLKSLGNVKDA